VSILGTRFGPAVLAFALLAVAQAPVKAADEDAAAADAAASTADVVAHRAPRSPVVSRVALMTKELGLDARQQTQVKAILEDQRAEIARIWSDPAVSSALRIGATQAIGDKTADRIRATLNDEQRKKYIKPRQREATVGAPGTDVQKWMKTAQGQEPPSAVAAPAAAKGN
jgi:hypothetical protein